MEATKTRLRRKILQERTALSANERAAKSTQICERIRNLLRKNWPQGATVLAFIPQRTEVDVFPVLDFLWQTPGFSCALPRILPGAEGKFLPIRSVEAADLSQENVFGIREPHGNKSVSPQEIDLVLVPAVAIDAQGNRLGYGRGFYDRFFTMVRPDCRKWAVVFAVQRVEKIPAAPYDIPVDAVVDENSFFPFFPRHGL